MSATVIRGGALGALQESVAIAEAGSSQLSKRSLAFIGRAHRMTRGIRHGEALIGLSRLESKAALTAALRVPPLERSAQLQRAIAVLEIASEAD